MNNSLNINIEVTSYMEDEEYFRCSRFLYRGFTVDIWCDVDRGDIWFEVTSNNGESLSHHNSLYKAITYIDNLLKGTSNEQ